MIAVTRNGRLHRLHTFETERDFETFVEQAFQQILSTYRLVRWRGLIKDQNPFEKNRRPDYLLIDEEFRNWYVVEIELKSHSLTSHVYPQVSTFASGQFDQDDYDAIVRHEPALDDKRFYQLFYYSTPDVLVVVDDRTALVDEWRKLKDELGVSICVVEVFSAEGHPPILEVSGDVPTPPVKTQTPARVHAHLNAIIPQDGAMFAGCTTVKIVFDGRQRTFQVSKAQDIVFLQPEPGVRLSKPTKFILLLRENGVFELEIK